MCRPNVLRTGPVVSSKTGENPAGTHHTWKKEKTPLQPTNQDGLLRERQTYYRIQNTGTMSIKGRHTTEYWHNVNAPGEGEITPTTHVMVMSEEGERKRCVY